MKKVATNEKVFIIIVFSLLGGASAVISATTVLGAAAIGLLFGALGAAAIGLLHRIRS